MKGSSLPYRTYRLATALLQPFAAPYLHRRLRRSKEDRERLGERTGEAGQSRPAGPLAWIHGASVGEALAVLPLVERLVGRGLAVLVTTGTVTSAAVLRDRLPPGAVHQFIPLDLPVFARRFLAHWRPDLALFAESELWPNLVVETARRGIPLALVNARLSRRSFARWQRFPQLIGDLMGCTTLCLAQTPADADRLRALGAPQVTVTGNLKFDAPPPPADPATLARLRGAIGSRPVWLAASTHVEEEALILAVDRQLRSRLPGLLTLIVPRQPGRGAPIAAAAAVDGTRVGMVSAGHLPEPATAIFLGDRVGEIGPFLRLAPVVFVGKSLAGGGGQNPIEPAKLGCAILHGPRVANFEAVYALLDEAGGARPVADAAALAAALADLLADPGRSNAMAEAAREAVEREAGATDRTVALLHPLLQRIKIAAASP